jgi:hypothetical protein
LQRLDQRAPYVVPKLVPDATDSTGTRFTWDAGTIPAGTWLAQVNPIQHREAWEIPAGTVERQLVVPPLGTVRVSVVDASTGSTIAGARVSWSDGDLEGVSVNTSAPARKDAQTGTWSFETAYGKVAMSVTAEGYVQASAELELGEPTGEQRFVLERATELRLEIWEGDARLAPSFDFWFALRYAGPGDAPWANVVPGPSTQTTWSRAMPGGGHYRVTFPTLEGYLPIQPLDVSIAAGETKLVRVQVERTP